uniref:Uncharacterized protein n=1 Tax=Triticum urartu TaxID=4572 RepID=A0A8R7K3C4_TRIUA
TFSIALQGFELLEIFKCGPDELKTGHVIQSGLDQVNISDDYFLEQVGVFCSLNLAKFRLNYATHRDLGEIMKHQVTWDPGGSTWHRLEVKPDFKEGGMLATAPTLVMGWTIGRAYWAWA